jgi:hypothetical protein
MKCLRCKWKQNIPGNTHIRCIHPLIHLDDPLADLLSITGHGPPDRFLMSLLDVSAEQHGIENGYFCFPYNFDPTWLINCGGFENEIQSKN